MGMRAITLGALAMTLAILPGHFREARAQARQEPAPKQAASTAGARADDAERKSEILNSAQWRRAMFEFKEWLSAQQLYNAQQVEQIKARFNQRVAAMSADELSFLLSDMEAKFQIIDSPQAQEARAWMAQYLSVMSDKKRAEVLKKMPNVATMTAAQLQAELTKIEAKQATIDEQQAAFNRTRQAQVSSQLQRDRTERREYVSDRNSFPASSYSPYHTSNVNSRLNRGQIGTGMSYYVTPYGGVGMSFSPSSW
jgi:hypothetical protein